jgi:hypothetical protein
MEADSQPVNVKLSFAQRTGIREVAKYQIRYFSWFPFLSTEIFLIEKSASNFAYSELGEEFWEKQQPAFLCLLKSTTVSCDKKKICYKL